MGNVFDGSRKRIYWYDQYALNADMAAFARYDPDRITQELVDTGADIIALYAANQFSIAYYPSEVWPQHPALQGRDYFGDLCSRLQARGKTVIAYINWLESRHPEWNHVPIGTTPTESRLPLVDWAEPDDPEKRVRAVPGGDWQFACRMSPRRDQVLAVTREIVTRYRPDGFHLDMFHGDGEVCLCETCRPAVEAICGTTRITPEIIREHWADYIDWRCAGTTSLIRELSTYLHANGVFAAHNAAWPIGLSVLYGFTEEWLPHLDVYVSEIFSDIHSAAMTVRWHHALGKPSCELQTSTAPYFAHLSIPRARWELAAATCKANGCHVFGPCGVGAFPDATTSPEVLQNVKAGFDAFVDDEDLSTGARSAATVALVFSWATRKYFRAGALDWSDAISGWSHVLIENHLPFDMLIAEDVASAGDLERYDLVILPEIACVSRAFVDAVQEYVSNGGALIATDETSLYDERGRPRQDFALSTVLGCNRESTLPGRLAVKWADAEPRPVLGPFQAITSTGEVLAQQFEVDPAGPVSGQNDPMPTGPGPWPAVCLNTLGSGQAAYTAWEPGAAYLRHRLPHNSVPLMSLVDALLPRRPVVCTAPACVEVTLWEQPEQNRRILHLANRTQTPENLEKVNEVVELPSMNFRMPVPAGNVEVSGRHAHVTCERDGDDLVIRVLGMRAYAAVVVTALKS